jgi:hypothetical protein
VQGVEQSQFGVRLPTERGPGRLGPLSQSGFDWAYAKRALAHGESPALVAAAIASYRRGGKHNPREYADRTVKKTGEALKAEAARDIAEPERP